MQKNFINNITLFWQFIKYVIKQFFKDNCFESASALTYTSLLSLVPFMAVTVFVMRGIPYFQELWGQTQEFIFMHFVPATGREVQIYLQEFIKNTGQLPTVGVIFLVLSAMILIYTIELTLNRIWGVKASRGLVNSFLLYWAVLTFLPILMGLSFGFSTYLWSLPIWQSTATQLGILNYVLAIIPFLLTWLSFALIYILIPNCRVNRLHAFGIAFVIAIAFSISKRLFASYVAGINLNALLYGAFATVPFFLLWIYISWLLILIGAEMVSAMGFYKFSARSESEWRFVQAYRWIAILWYAQGQGLELTSDELFAKEGKMTASEPYKQLQKLEQSNWIKKTADGGYILARDLSKYTLYDFYNSLPWRLPNYDILQGEHDDYVKLLIEDIKKIDLSIEQNTPQSLQQRFTALTSA